MSRSAPPKGHVTRAANVVLILRHLMSAKMRLIQIAIIVTAVVSAWTPARAADASADLVVKNAKVYTVDANRSWASAVAVRSGKIVYVGSDLGASNFVGVGTHVVDLKGMMILPGFHDAHVHPAVGGKMLLGLTLDELQTADEILAEIKAYADRHPEEEWILGMGWSWSAFDKVKPTRQLLDVISNSRPIFLVSKDGHDGWANSKALELAGITATTPDPEDGKIERDPRTGEPTGVLFELAQYAVRKIIPIPKPEAQEALYKAYLKAGLSLANKFGITSFVEAAAVHPFLPDGGPARLETYMGVAADGDLTARVMLCLAIDSTKGRPDQIGKEIDRLKGLRQRIRSFDSPLLRAECSKIFLDGTFQNRSALLVAPYLGTPDDVQFRGPVKLSPDVLQTYVQKLEAAGFQIHMHAVGDGAVREGLDAIEYANSVNRIDDRRHNISHLELVDPQDIGRFAKLHVVANFQAAWAYPSDTYKKYILPSIGPARAEFTMPMGSVARSGAVVVGGSDWFVTSLDPLVAIQVGVTRSSPYTESDEVLNPSEAVDLEEMIDAYTINGALVMHQEGVTGSVEVGKFADLIALDKNLFEIPKAEISKAKVLWTLLQGKEVYRAEAFSD